MSHAQIPTSAKPLLVLGCLVLVAAAACGELPPQAPKLAAAPVVVQDYSQRRIGERQTVAIALGVTVHADLKTVDETGFVHLHGKVFLDAANPIYKKEKGIVLSWPKYGYSDAATWDPKTHTLTLLGNAAIEETHVAIASLGPNTKMVLDGYKFKIYGQISTQMRPLKKTEKKAPVL